MQRYKILAAYKNCLNNFQITGTANETDALASGSVTPNETDALASGQTEPDILKYASSIGS